MIEVQLIDFLTDEQTGIGVYVGMEASDQTTNYVLIDKTGSSRTNRIITSTVAIQSYGASLYEAMQLNETVKTAMEGFETLDDIVRVELETDYNFTNTATKQYRWQAVYQITHY